MNAYEYQKRMEEKLVKEFLESFYDKIGYYPKVITGEENKSINLLTLNRLEDYFDPYLPTIRGTKIRLDSNRRTMHIVELRFIFFHIARSLKYTLKEIGRHLGNRDHTTIIHGLKTFKNLYQTDEKFKELYHIILNSIKKDYESSALEHIDKMEIKS